MKSLILKKAWGQITFWLFAFGPLCGIATFYFTESANKGAGVAMALILVVSATLLLAQEKIHDDLLRDVESIRVWMLEIHERMVERGDADFGKMISRGEEAIYDFLLEKHKGVYPKEHFEKLKRVIIEEKLIEWFVKYHIQPFLEDHNGNYGQWFRWLKKAQARRKKP